ncbi:hypothetical protein [Streptomyces sp. NPDC055080]
MSDSFPPPPSPSPSPWPPSQPSPPRKQRTGLIVTLSVGGGLLAATAVAALVYTAMDRAAPGSLETLPSRSAGTPSAEAFPGEDPVAEPSATGTAPEEDVRITKCTVDSLTNWPAAELRVVNGSGGPADYVVTVEFVDKDGTRVADGIAAVLALDAGKEAKEKAQGLGDVPRGTKCRITEVTRTVSGR